MAIGDFSYGEYGLTEIDSYSSSTMASSIFVDIQDSSQNIGIVKIIGSIQTDSPNNHWFAGAFADSSNNQLNAEYRNMTTGTTSSGGSSSASFMYLSRYIPENDNYTSYDPVTLGSAVGMLEFEATITLERTSSAPIRKPFIAIRTNYFISTNFITTYVTGTCLPNTTPTQFKFYATDGNVTGSIKVFSLCAHP